MSLIEVIIDKTGIRAGIDSGAGDHGSRKLIASLLALVARSDGGISANETTRIVNLLCHRFGLESNEAADLVARSVDKLPGEDQIDEVIESVNHALTRDQKEDLVFMVLCVIAADNEKDVGEMELLAKLVDGLKLSDEFMQKIYAREFDGLFY